MSNWKRGDQVELVRIYDPHSRLKQGDKGKVTHVDSLGTVHVKWDNGCQLGIIESEGDVIRKIS